jgi:hypothetical protein
MVPHSQAITGYFLRWNVAALYLTSGGLLLACTVFLSFPRIGRALSVKIDGD